MDILQAVFPVFLVIGIGLLLRRYRFLDQGFIDIANRLVYYVLLPCLLFSEISATEFREAFSAPLVLGGYAATLVTISLAFFMSKRLPVGPSERGSFVQGTVRANLAYVGLPVVYNAVGQTGLLKAGILLGFTVPLLNALAVVALIVPHGAGKGKGWETARRILYQIATNPIVLTCLIAITWSLLELPVPSMARRTMRLIAPATLPLSLLCLGGAFSMQRAREGISIAALSALLKLILVPGLALAFYRWMGVTGIDLRVGMIMLACPTAVVTYVMAAQMDGNADLAGTIVITSTVASAVTITGWLFLLRAFGW